MQYIAYIFLLFCLSVKSQPGIRMIPDCKGLPKYLGKTGFDISKPFAFSVGESKVIGLAMTQFIYGKPQKVFTMSDWHIGGYLGGVVTDKNGNAVVFPRPFINTLNNDPQKQNVLYRVNSLTGRMNVFCTLPFTLKTSNPFGVLGLTYDCETDVFYVATVEGSSLNRQNGRIYVLKNKNSCVVVDSLVNTDAMGLAVSYFDGKKYLYYGRARSSEIYRVAISEMGIFTGKSEFVLGLSDLGDRGDDKARKIKFEKGVMRVSGITFDFNLSGQTNKMENIYTFRYVSELNRWMLIGVEKGQM